MKYSALIGNPTGHSVSHFLYSELVKVIGYPDFYQHVRIDVKEDELKQVFEALRTLHFVGLSVTLPFKLEIIKYLDELDPVVQELGAVNTIHLGETAVGYNTDWVGIIESVKRLGGSKDFTAAVIFGTGGAARASIYACRKLGIKNINVLYRHKASKATKHLQEHASRLNITLQDYSTVIDSVTQSQLIINATSAGMIGRDSLPFDPGLLEHVALQDKVFLEVVYNPLNTPLLQFFRSEGATAIDGLWMMIYQGIEALSIWLSSKVDVAPKDLMQIHTLLENEIGRHKVGINFNESQIIPRGFSVQ